MAGNGDRGARGSPGGLGTGQAKGRDAPPAVPNTAPRTQRTDHQPKLGGTGANHTHVGLTSCGPMVPLPVPGDFRGQRGLTSAGEQLQNP